jgi:hypothetical protein
MSSPVTHIDDHTISVRAPKSSGFSILASQVIAAVRDGLTSMHHYEDLRAHGTSHAAAAKRACAFKS